MRSVRRLMVVLAVLLATSVPAAALADCSCEDCCCCADGSLTTVVFHLPLAFNDGTAIPEALIEDLLTDVTEIAGGFTYSEATGGWLHEGKLYREAVWVVKVGLSDDRVDGFLDMVEARLKGDFKQIAVWVEEAGEAEIR